MEQLINKLYSKNVIHISQDASLSEANDLMNNYNIRHLPVVNEENYLVGILSKSDYIALKYVDSRFKGFCVKDVMTSPVKVVSHFTKVTDVAKLFLVNKLSSVLIARNDELAGILTTEDLLKLLADYPEKMRQYEELDLAALADEGWVSATFN